MAGTHGHSHGAGHGHGGHGAAGGAAIAERAEPSYELSEAERRRIARKEARDAERERLERVRFQERQKVIDLGGEIKHLAHEIHVLEERLGLLPNKEKMGGSLRGRMMLQKSPEEIARESAEDQIAKENAERAAKHMEKLTDGDKEKIITE